MVAVVYHPRARQALFELYDYIFEHSGPERAGDFVEAIASYCDGFESFPERGARRDDLAPGLRVIGFRRRVSIVFAVEPERCSSLASSMAGGPSTSRGGTRRTTGSDRSGGVATHAVGLRVETR